MLTQRPASRTRQRLHRRNLRRALGTTKESLPNLNTLLNAVRPLASMIDNESNGRFGLTVYDYQTGLSIPVGTAIQLLTDAQAKAKQDQEDALARYDAQWRDQQVTS